MNNDKNKLSDFMLWIDMIFNHGFFEHLVAWNYWLWNHTSYKFCTWICDHWEYIVNE